MWWLLWVASRRRSLWRLLRVSTLRRSLRVGQSVVVMVDINSWLLSWVRGLSLWLVVDSRNGLVLDAGDRLAVRSGGGDGLWLVSGLGDGLIWRRERGRGWWDVDRGRWLIHWRRSVDWGWCRLDVNWLVNVDWLVDVNRLVNVLDSWLDDLLHWLLNDPLLHDWLLNDPLLDNWLLDNPLDGLADDWLLDDSLDDWLLLGDSLDWLSHDPLDWLLDHGSGWGRGIGDWSWSVGGRWSRGVGRSGSDWGIDDSGWGGGDPSRGISCVHVLDFFELVL